MAPKRGKGRSGSAHDADPEKPLHKKKKVKSLGDESESEEGGGMPNAKVKKEKDEDVKQIAEKKDLDKMYQAMKYQASKGNTSPLQQYNRMTNKKDKHEFYMKYLQDKKFEWVAMEEKKETATSKETSTASGWMSKFQVADYEKSHLIILCFLPNLRAYLAGNIQYKPGGMQVSRSTSTQQGNWTKPVKPKSKVLL